MKKTNIIRKRASTNKGRFRLAIVGMGLRGVLMVENIRKSVPDIEIVALVDTIGERAELAKNYFGLEVPVYADIDHCLDEVAPEGVAVFTQDAFHVAPVVKVLRHGAHVFCEKPMALTLKDCDTMIAAAKDSKAIFYMGFNLRHMPFFSTIRKIISGGELGDLLTLEMNEYYSGGRSYFRRWNRLSKISGGLWLTKATHDFDIMRWLSASEPASVYAIGGKKLFLPKKGAAALCRNCDLRWECDDYQPMDTISCDERARDTKQLEFWNRWQQLGGKDYLPSDTCLYRGDSDTIEYGTASVKFENDVCASYTMNVVTTPQASGRWMVAMGTKGSLRADPKTSLIEVSYRGGRRPSRTYDVGILTQAGSHGGADGRILSDFIRTCRRNAKPVAGWADGRAAVAMGIAATRSMKTGQAVRITSLK